MAAVSLPSIIFIVSVVSLSDYEEKLLGISMPRMGGGYLLPRAT